MYSIIYEETHLARLLYRRLSTTTHLMHHADFMISVLFSSLDYHLFDTDFLRTFFAPSDLAVYWD